VQVLLANEENLLLGPGGERLPLRRSAVEDGTKGVPVVIDEFPVGVGKREEGAVPVEPRIKDKFAVGKGKIADGAVPTGPRMVELNIGKGKLAEGFVKDEFVFEIPVLKGIATVEELAKGVAEGRDWLPVRLPLSKEPEKVFGEVPVGPTRTEVLDMLYGVAKGDLVPERSPSLYEPEKGAEAVFEALADREGMPLGEVVIVSGMNAPFEMLYKGILVDMVVTFGKATGVEVTGPLFFGDGLGVDSIPERGAFDSEPEKGGVAVR
jgi:hypothetical protein